MGKKISISKLSKGTIMNYLCTSSYYEIDIETSKTTADQNELICEVNNIQPYFKEFY